MFSLSHTRKMLAPVFSNLKFPVVRGGYRIIKSVHAWPLSDLSLVTPRLQLRLPTDRELNDLAHSAGGNILGEGEEDFLHEWALLSPGTFERNLIQYHWGARGNWHPDHWRLQLGVFPRGEARAVGCMGLAAENFALGRTVSTGSWLLAPYQKQGLGKEMRSAVLQLAFDGLGAIEARSSAHPRNHASLGVSRALGYREDGTTHFIKNGRRVQQTRLCLLWSEFRPACPVQISGLEGCRTMFGAPALPADGPAGELANR